MDRSCRNVLHHPRGTWLITGCVVSLALAGCVVSGSSNAPDTQTSASTFPNTTLQQPTIQPLPAFDQCTTPTIHTVSIDSFSALLLVKNGTGWQKIAPCAQTSTGARYFQFETASDTEPFLLVEEYARNYYLTGTTRGEWVQPSPFRDSLSYLQNPLSGYGGRFVPRWDIPRPTPRASKTILATATNVQGRTAIAGSSDVRGPLPGTLDFEIPFQSKPSAPNGPADLIAITETPTSSSGYGIKVVRDIPFGAGSTTIDLASTTPLDWPASQLAGFAPLSGFGQSWVGLETGNGAFAPLSWVGNDPYSSVQASNLLTKNNYSPLLPNPSTLATSDRFNIGFEDLHYSTYDPTLGQYVNVTPYYFVGESVIRDSSPASAPLTWDQNQIPALDHTALIQGLNPMAIGGLTYATPAQGQITHFRIKTGWGIGSDTETTTFTPTGNYHQWYWTADLTPGYLGTASSFAFPAITDLEQASGTTFDAGFKSMTPHAVSIQVQLNLPNNFPSITNQSGIISRQAILSSQQIFFP